MNKGQPVAGFAATQDNVIEWREEFNVARYEDETKNIRFNVRKKIRTYKREGLKLSRNDPCHCGSGKKYKKCCI